MEGESLLCVWYCQLYILSILFENLTIRWSFAQNTKFCFVSYYNYSTLLIRVVFNLPVVKKLGSKLKYLPRTRINFLVVISVVIYLGKEVKPLDIEYSPPEDSKKKLCSYRQDMAIKSEKKHHGKHLRVRRKCYC